MNELKTDDPAKVRAAGAIDLPTIQRYLNFHYSVTIDLFGADQSSNAATFYSSGLKGRFEEGKRTDDHVLKGQTYKVLEVQDGQLVEKEVPMLNALNEVLRDDFIKDSVAGVGRWNKVIEKAGIAIRLVVPHKAFHRQIGALAGIKMSPDGRVVSEAEWKAKETSGCRRAEDRAFVASLMGRVRRAGQVRRLDRAAGDGHQPPAGRLRIRPLRLMIRRDGDGHRRRGVIKQHLIDPEICIRCNTCEATCPVDAITHDDRNYVVRADVCNDCMACISPCPTGSIDNWRTMPLVRAYSIEEQLDLGRAAARAHARAARGRGRRSPTRRRSAAAGRAAQAGRRERRGGVQLRRVRRHRAAVVGRARLHQPVRAEEPDHARPWSATSTAPRRASTTRRTTSCSTSAPCRSRCSRASRSASSRRASTPTAGRTSRASTRSPARATASGPATTTSR